MFKGFSRNILVVLEGVHKGIFIVEMERRDGKRIFLGLPDKGIHEIPEADVEAGVKKKILKVVEKLPRHVYNVCKAEYKLITSEQKQRCNSNH